MAVIVRRFRLSSFLSTREFPPCHPPAAAAAPTPTT